MKQLDAALGQGLERLKAEALVARGWADPMLEGTADK